MVTLVLQALGCEVSAINTVNYSKTDTLNNAITAKFDQNQDKMPVGRSVSVSPIV